MNKIESNFKHRGLRCVVVAQDMGHRCGYVEVTKHHASFDKDLDDELLENIEVHGGLTFSQKAENGYPIESKGWWFGFDCGHFMDAKDPSIMSEEYKRIDTIVPAHFSQGEIRTKEYVEDECKNLAEQLMKI